jgi:hypothetical protein
VNPIFPASVVTEQKPSLPTGYTFDAGFGVGEKWEGHIRMGVTLTYPII